MIIFILMAILHMPRKILAEGTLFHFYGQYKKQKFPKNRFCLNKILFNSLICETTPVLGGKTHEDRKYSRRINSCKLLVIWKRCSIEMLDTSAKHHLAASFFIAMWK